MRKDEVAAPLAPPGHPRRSGMMAADSVSSTAQPACPGAFCLHPSPIPAAIAAIPQALVGPATVVDVVARFPWRETSVAPAQRTRLPAMSSHVAEVRALGRTIPDGSPHGAVLAHVLTTLAAGGGARRRRSRVAQVACPPAIPVCVAGVGAVGIAIALGCPRGAVCIQVHTIVGGTAGGRRRWRRLDLAFGEVATCIRAAGRAREQLRPIVCELRRGHLRVTHRHAVVRRVHHLETPAERNLPFPEHVRGVCAASGDVLVVRAEPLRL
mmetsp:Transcript_116070/g.333347  ORF Transcript_116070/g.333347 Transcript_116070/m.333347 type:complete len:268 (-) Transcript_116070:597-1400(-)